MSKKLEDLLQERSFESQKRILEKAQNLFNTYLYEDCELMKLAEQAKMDETVRVSIKALRTRTHKNHT